MVLTARWERKDDGIALATVGLFYNFRNRTWNKENEVVITTYDDRELKILQERMNQLVNDNEALRRQLQGSAHRDITDIKVENNVIVSPILITFPINGSVVSNQARVNLGFFSKVIKAGNPNRAYHIARYSDKGAGPQR